MSDLRFHVSSACLRSFPLRFRAYHRKGRFVSSVFPRRFLPLPFVSCFLPIYGQRETRVISRPELSGKGNLTHARIQRRGGLI